MAYFKLIALCVLSPLLAFSLPFLSMIALLGGIGSTVNVLDEFEAKVVNLFLSDDTTKAGKK